MLPSICFRHVLTQRHSVFVTCLCGECRACLRSVQQATLKAHTLLQIGGRDLHRGMGWFRPQALLPPGMTELLRLAAEGGAEGAGPWPRVHAFNTLRLAFIERILAVSATAFVADGACPMLAPRWCVWTLACSFWNFRSRLAYC